MGDQYPGDRPAKELTRFYSLIDRMTEEADPANRTGGEADPTFRPGTWLRKQDKARTDGKLTQQQTALLDALHRHAETVAG
ncbi:hypothetical protein ACIG0C_30885 [Kitasatospora aureofaciens]|uniref:Helicase-associated domain-containing protein n=2 Tax=Kitasatospora aureofaciens TaxID=1894 RepID=A0A1E7N9I6_KITAU|nr:helicase associated domain-containing protein [Kitasatospora aureofaciens]OEV37357.1 hypothetical protein HS99_0006115 [Kitasatospora aureofaciens]UKZ03015.1 helicase associated domain-containing protein [Streptomyces viridifaciens]GGV00536.1 hypothetical protein GCM10010502_63790 [Kitasatospora aureofaciens]